MLTAGNNITISEDNTISSTITNTDALCLYIYSILTQASETYLDDTEYDSDTLTLTTVVSSSDLDLEKHLLYYSSEYYGTRVVYTYYYTVGCSGVDINVSNLKIYLDSAELINLSTQSGFLIEISYISDPVSTTGTIQLTNFGSCYPIIIDGATTAYVFCNYIKNGTYNSNTRAYFNIVIDNFGENNYYLDTVTIKGWEYIVEER